MDNCNFFSEREDSQFREYILEELMSISETSDTKNVVTLYGMAAELSQLEEFMNEESFSEQGEETQEQIAAKLQSLTVMMTHKTDAVCGYNQSLDDFQDAIASRIKELQDLKKRVEKKQSRFHDYILSALDRLGTSKITGTLYTISARKPLKAVEIENENLLPSRYIKLKETVDIDKKQIAEDLKNGMIIEGALLKDGKRSLSFKAGK